LFIEAAGDGIWKIFLDDEPPAELADVDPRFKERMQASMSYMGSRTKFFDDFFLATAAAGIRQAVILAAGLDARAWRLAWPKGSVVYEIDQPQVLAFKLETLASHDVTPIATHVSVGIDLRQDWPKALADAGFDPSAPTAWSAEGLLPYLTAEAQDLLFDRIQSLSGRGSRIAVEAFTMTSSAPRASRAVKSRWSSTGQSQPNWVVRTSPSPATSSTKRNGPRSPIG
jgi:methyltransferase (TIGR00027 family)